MNVCYILTSDQEPFNETESRKNVKKEKENEKKNEKKQTADRSAEEKHKEKEKTSPSLKEGEAVCEGLRSWAAYSPRTFPTSSANFSG